jgi:hypothetical protein
MPNDQPPRWLQALPSLFALGAGMGGAPPVGTGAIVGAEQGRQRALVEEQQQLQNTQRQQQLDMQTASLLAAEQARQAQAEERRQSAIKAAVDDLRVQKFTKKEDYDAAVTFRENLIGQTYGALRPNTLRTLVPFNGPTAESRAAEAMDKITKQKNWEDIITNNGRIMFDRDGDGIDEVVPVLELAEIAKFPIARDPQSGQPILPPKEVKTENLSDFEGSLQDVLEVYKLEGKDITDPRVKLAAREDVRRRMAAASRQGTASVVVQTGAAGSDAEAVAEAIISGDQPPDLKGMYGMGPKVRAVLARRGYNLTTAQQDWSATQRHLLTLNGPQQLRMRQAIDIAYHALDVIEQLADKWKGGRFPVLNRARVMAAKNGVLGPEAQQIATALDSQIADVTSELANVYMGGNSPTDHAMSLAAKNLSLDWSEGTLRTLLKQQRQNLLIRQNSIANAGAIGASTANPYAPQTGTATMPAPAPAGGQFSVVAPNGKTYTFATQEQLDKFKVAAGIK